MKKRAFLFLFAILWLGTLVGCGKDIISKQERQRNEMNPELVGGTWVSRCENKSVARLVFTDTNLTIAQDKFYDAECKDSLRTVSQIGTFKLAHNFKEGINNGIVFVAGDKFEVTQHADMEVDGQNNVLTQIQNENESKIEPAFNAQQRRDATRANLRIREAKAITVWKRGEAKSLNRLQHEKVAGLGLGENPFVDFDSRALFQYEYDNGFLQVKAPVIGGRVFTKQ